MSAADADSADARHVAAEAAGLRRFYRSTTVNTLIWLLVALVVVGGGVAVLLADSHHGRAAAGAALIAVGLALLWAFLAVMRYLGVARRLDDDTAAEVARRRAHAGRRLRRFLGEDTSPGRAPFPSGLRIPPDVPDDDPYEAMRGLGYADQRADGVNRTDDPRRGPIE